MLYYKCHIRINFNKFLLFLFIASKLFCAEIIKVTPNYVLINSDSGLGKVGDKIIIQRRINEKIVDIGKVMIVKFKNNMTVAKIIKENSNYKIQVGDFVKATPKEQILSL